MKIAFLNIYNGRVDRGAEVAVAQIAQRLSKKHEVVVYQSGNKTNVYKTYIVKNLPLLSSDVARSITLKLLKKVYLDPYNLLVFFFSLICLKDLLSQKYDVILPINGFWQILICKLAQKIKGGKVAVMGYAGIGIDDYVNLKLRPDIFFAMTETAATWAKSVSPKANIKVASGGVDLDTFKPTGEKLDLNIKGPIVLVVGALVPYKRIDLTIKAVAKMGRASLIVAGNGILKEEIEQLGHKLLGTRFKRLDINYTELPSLYRSADVFTLASSHAKDSLFYKVFKTRPSEAFGIVYVEAMACGLPVVAPDDPLRREIIDDAGVYFEDGNVEEYAKAISQAISKSWGKIPLYKSQRYDWEKIVTGLSNDLNSLII